MSAYASSLRSLGCWFKNFNNQKEGNGKYPQRFALSEQVCDLHPECFIMIDMHALRAASEGNEMKMRGNLPVWRDR